MSMLATSLRKIVVCLVCALVIVGNSNKTLALTIFAPEAAGAVISNRAEASYRDDTGADYSVFSPVVTVTVQTVASLQVTPDETAPSAAVGPQERLTRVFRVCNTGNATDSYTITNAEVNAPATLADLFFDNDGNGAVSNPDTLVTVNGAASSAVATGTCLGVLAVVDTNDSPANSL
ncbi:MAG TPA: hypothetical protein VKB46_24870, partial [Pyrinomonadaceae bacterium]|nr:hypothetical protein [Pyrinomonadaceae bacterium]